MASLRPPAGTARALCNQARRSQSRAATYFVGASCSSMSPLMKVAMLPAAALVSSADFETVNFLSSSSSTLMDVEFSDLVLAALVGTDSMTDGISSLFLY